MYTLEVALPEDRDFCGNLTIVDAEGNTVLGPFTVAGRACDLAAQRHGNSSRSGILPFGDTPTGTFIVKRLFSLRGAAQEEILEFGRFGVLALEARDGDCALADAAGRLEFWLHGGALSDDGRLRSTNGSLRISNSDHQQLMKFMYGREGLAARVTTSSELPCIIPVADLYIDRNDPPFVARPQHDKFKNPFLWASSVAALPPVQMLALGEYDAGTSYSSVDPSVVITHEGLKSVGYTLNPASFPNSGVTIAAGYDLGQHTADQIIADCNAAGLPASVGQDLSQYAGALGQNAAAVYNNLGAPSMTNDQAVALMDAVLPANFTYQANSYDNASANFMFSDLPWQAQTVIADLGYWFGNINSMAPNFWSQVTNGQWGAAYNNLMNFGMTGNGAIARLQNDGALWGQAINAGTFPSN